MKLAIVHTVSSLVPVFRALTDELLPGVDVFNIVDESLLRQAIADESVTPALAARVARQLWAAEAGGADLILVSCSSIGYAAERARGLVGVPVVRVDEAMALAAVAAGPRIQVLATLRSTLEPTTELIGRMAAEAGRPADVRPLVVDGAYRKAIAGDTTGHDELIREALDRAMGDADVVVLAQASMARAAATLPESSRPVPILTSPRLAVEKLALMIASGSSVGPAL